MTTPSPFTIAVDPALLTNAKSVDIPWQEESMELDSIVIDSAIRTASRAPLAWVELNGFVNLCPNGYIPKGGKKYIYSRTELTAAIDAMNSAQPIIVTSNTQLDAVIATGIVPVTARLARGAVDTDAARAAFGVKVMRGIDPRVAFAGVK